MSRHFSLNTIGLIFTDIGFFHRTEAKKALREIKAFLNLYPELSLMAHLQPFFIHQQDSQISFWKALAGHIRDHYDDVDAFVVIADPSSILYPAVALSFILEHLNKPVIFTGLPFTDEKMEWSKSLQGLMDDTMRLGVEANLISALQLSVVGRPEVLVAYGPQAIRAVKARQVRGTSLEYFDSIDEKGISRIGLDLDVSEETKSVKTINKPLKLRDEFEPDVQLFSIVPGDTLETVEKKIAETLSAAVIDTTAVGYFSPQWIRMISARPQTLFLLYPSPGQIQPLVNLSNVLLAPPVTLETTFVKFSWLLATEKDKGRLATALKRDVCGELS